MHYSYSSRIHVSRRYPVRYGFICTKQGARVHLTILSLQTIFENLGISSATMHREPCKTNSQNTYRKYWMVYRGPGFLAVVWVGPSTLPSVSSTRKTLKERQVVKGEGGEGGGRGAESYDRKKAWSSINLLILTDVKRRIQCAYKWTASLTSIFGLRSFSHLVLLCQRFNFRVARFRAWICKRLRSQPGGPVRQSYL